MAHISASKARFRTRAGAFPGSTRPEALAALCEALLAVGAVRLATGDRSGMDRTRQVLEQNGVVRMAAEFGADLDVFDDLTAEGRERRAVQGGHWSRGFAPARPVTIPSSTLTKAQPIEISSSMNRHRQR
jgi:uncharacterized protein (DUF362 family)